MIYEAHLGQTVEIECNVNANPLSSVHYAWFSTNTTFVDNFSADLLSKDTSFDEQIDETRFVFKLKLKLKPNVFFKCKQNKTNLKINKLFEIKNMKKKAKNCTIKSKVKKILQF